MIHWLLLEAEHRGVSSQHIVPAHDLKPHYLHQHCWCQPIEEADTPDAWVHKAMDQRDRYESGELRLQ